LRDRNHHMEREMLQAVAGTVLKRWAKPTIRRFTAGSACGNNGRKQDGKAYVS
jgi:hypothetical protein